MSRCDYCGSRWKEDDRGNCVSCGAPYVPKFGTNYISMRDTGVMYPNSTHGSYSYPYQLQINGVSIGELRIVNANHTSD